VAHFLPDQRPGRAALEALRDNRLGLVRFRQALDPASLPACQAAIVQRRTQAEVNRYVNGTLTTFGVYLARHLKNPTDYFDRAAHGDILFPRPRTDLRMQVRRLLSDAFALRSLNVAVEPDGRPYASAIVRLHADGVSNPLHNDHIARDAAGTGLVLAGLRHQFSCVVCLQECTLGGELELYRKLWLPADERFKVPAGLGYDEGVVAGCERLTFKPATGDVYVMNPKNYHAIAAVRGAERRTLGFFFGFFEDRCEDSVAWS
jgi:hypothetical protein